MSNNKENQMAYLITLQKTEGAFAGPPQERSCQVVNLIAD